MDPETTTAVGTGGGLLGFLALAYRYWKSRATDRTALRLAKEAIEDVESLRGELTQIKLTLADAAGQGRRNEAGIAEIRAQLQTMTAASTAAQIELASALGRIEGELRARRERGQVTS